MLDKKESKLKYFVVIVLILFFSVSYIYRTPVMNFFTKTYILFFQKDINIELTLSEKEELVTLREKVKILEDNEKKLSEEYQMIPDGLKPSFVKMLYLNSNFYSDFYVTHPKDKTVYKGMNILAGGNILVGQVDEVLDSSLRVTRIGKNESFIANGLESEESLELKSIGVGFYASSVSASSKFAVGDTIVLKGTPKIVVGNIVDIVKNDSSVMQVFVRAPYNLATKEIFYVLQ
jgi:hypothetical protein